MDTEKDREYLREAIELARGGVTSGLGGPFGCIIVRDGQVKDMIGACAGRDFLSVRDTAIIRVLFDTGARLSEAALLMLDDVDLDLDVIHVLGKGRRSRAIPFGANLPKPPKATPTASTSPAKDRAATSAIRTRAN